MRALTLIAGVSLCAALQMSWSARARAAASPGDTTSAAASPSDTTTAAADSTRSSSARKMSLSDLIRAAEARGDSAKAVADSMAADSTRTSGDSTLSAADSAAIAAAKALPDRFVPTSTSRVETNDVSVAIGTRLNTQIDAGHGWSLMQDISMQRRRYRTRSQEDINESAIGRADKAQQGLYKLGVQVGENYSKTKSFGLGRYGLDIVFDNTKADLEFSLLKPLLHASKSDFTVKAEGSKGMNDFKYNRSFSGTASGAMSYAIGDFLTLDGGAEARGRHETSFVGRTEFGPMPSDANTMRAAMRYGRDSTKTLEVTYSLTRGVDREVTPPRGNTFEVLNDPSQAKREERRDRAELLSVKSFLQPFPFLALQTNFAHSKETKKYRVDTGLSMGQEENSIKSNASYSYSARGNLQCGVSTKETVYDYGPVSLKSCTEREYVVDMGLSQKIGDSITVNLSGSGALQQRFYLKRIVNPNDADHLLYRGEFSLQAPYHRFNISINGNVSRDETINIDSTLSGDNRVQYKYQLGPTLRMRPAGWLSLTQDYNVKIEYTDFVFTEDKNYLNRTTTLNTRADFNISRSIAFSFVYGFINRDAGSYLMRTGGRRYSPTNETFEHALNLNVRYEVIKDFSVKAENNWRIQRSDIFGAQAGRRIIASSTTYESGGMRLGFERTKSFGERGGISLDVAYLRNYGPYITPERKEYWEADSELTLKF
jgi:hypothetical protein